MSESEKERLSDEGEDDAEPNVDDEKPSKKSKKTDELEKPFPDAFLVDTDSVADKDVLLAWSDTKWGEKQKASHPGIVQEIVVPASCTEVAKTVWRTWCHGARKRVWSRRDMLSGEVKPCHGVDIIWAKTAKCRWCNEHKLYQTSNQVLKTHMMACQHRPKAFGSPSGKSESQQQSQQSGGATGAAKRARGRAGSKINDAAIRMLAALALSFSFFLHPAVREFLAIYAEEQHQHQTGRQAVTDNTTRIAAPDRCSLLAMLKSVATTIAADGGTINLRKLLGMGLGAISKCFFWRLITVRSTDHLQVSKHLESAVIELMRAMVWER